MLPRNEGALSIDDLSTRPAEETRFTSDTSAYLEAAGHRFRVKSTISITNKTDVEKQADTVAFQGARPTVEARSKEPVRLAPSQERPKREVRFERPIQVSQTTTDTKTKTAITEKRLETESEQKKSGISINVVALISFLVLTYWLYSTSSIAHAARDDVRAMKDASADAQVQFKSDLQHIQHSGEARFDVWKW